MRRLFALRRGERIPALLFAVVIVLFQYLMVSKFWCLFADYSDASFVRFIRNFHMSGFDPITYDVVTRWNQGYDMVRHPLLAILMYPLCLANRLLWSVTGCNCVQLVVGVVWSLCGFYAMVFVCRTMREVIGIKTVYATLLTLLFLGFAYIVITIIVPDHFCLSLFCLSLTVYVTGLKMKRNGMFTPWQAVVLLTLTSGITLTNGAVVVLAVLMTNGRRFFSCRMMVAMSVSVLLLVAPVVVHEMCSEHDSMLEAVQRQTKWTSGSVSRLEVAEENLFGETMLLHRKHILGDVLRDRPVVVKYGFAMQYVVVGVIQLLFLAGLAVGLRRRFAWFLLGIFLFNVLLHIVCAFAIEEVYIMAAHWCFVVPLSVAWLFALPRRHLTLALAVLTTLVTLYLYAYNGALLYRYLTWPLTK